VLPSSTLYVPLWAWAVVTVALLVVPHDVHGAMDPDSNPGLAMPFDPAAATAVAARPVASLRAIDPAGVEAVLAPLQAAKTTSSEHAAKRFLRKIVLP
jgi:hypothetical protein